MNACRHILITISALIVFGAGCQQQETETASQMPAMTEQQSAGSVMSPVAKGAAVTKAIAVLHPTEGNEVDGKVIFTKDGNGEIRVVADAYGLTLGKHGFHIHEYGNCSAADGTSAGGHFNPDGKAHGGPNTAVRHVGDLGNIEADDQGIARLVLPDSGLALSGSHSIIGRSVIVHAGEDDLKSQPSGNAGARIACGVIGIDE